MTAHFHCSRLGTGDSIIHHDRLKRCNNREIPLWLRRLSHQYFEESIEKDSNTTADPDATIPYQDASRGMENFEFLLDENQNVEAIGSLAQIEEAIAKQPKALNTTSFILL